MKKKFLSSLNFVVFFLIGIFLLYLVFRKVNIQQVLGQIFEANYWWVLLSFICAFISHFARALRWNILINSMGHKTRAFSTFYAVMIGYFANMAIPRLGEVSKCGVLHKKDGIPFDSLLGSVVAERVFDLFVLLVLIFTVIVFQMKLVGGFVNQLVVEPLVSKFSNNISAILIAGGIIMAMILACVILYRVYNERLQQSELFNKIKGFLKGFMDGAKTIWKLEKRFAFLFYTFIIWFMYFLMTYVVFFAMDATSSLTIIDGLTVLAIGSLGMVAPVPGGIGAYHFIVKALLFELYLIPNDIAASWATMVHASQSLLIVFLGTFSYFMILSMKRKSNEQPQPN